MDRYIRQPNIFTRSRLNTSEYVCLIKGKATGDPKVEREVEV